MVVPLTVMVSPLAKPDDSELVPAAPESVVALVITCGGVCWLVATAPVALLDGSKKSFPAATAEAATSVVFASVPIAVFNAVFRFCVVAAGSNAPDVVAIRKLPVGGGFWVVAVNVTDDVVPSGRLKLSVTWSPEPSVEFELRLSETDAGEPEGPLNVTAPAGVDDTELNLRPNGELAVSSETEKEDVV